jgi:WD40 repeat protein
MRPFQGCLFCTLVTVALGADAGQSQPRAHDVHGDPLPPDAVARFGTLRFRHDGSILFAAFLPDGKSVCSVSSDGVICLWEFPSGKEIRRFEVNSAKEWLGSSAVKITSLSQSPDGKYLTAFCSDDYVRIFDWANVRQTGKVVNAVGAFAVPDPPETTTSFGTFSKTTKAKARTSAIVSGPVYSPDGKTLMILGASGVLQFVDLPTGKEVGPSLGHTVALTALWFTPDGKRLFTKDSKSTHTWDVARGTELGSSHLKLPPNPGNPIIISPDGRFGVSVARFTTAAKARAAESREAVLFDTATGKELAEIALDVEVAPVHRRPIVFWPDSTLLAVSQESDNGKEQIACYEVPSGKLLRTLQVAPGEPNPAAGKGKGKAAKGGGWGGGPGGFGPGGIGVLDANLHRMLFSPDGKVLAFQANPATAIVLLDSVTGNKIGSLRPEGGLALHGTFSPDGRCLALRQRDGTVTVYELATGLPRRTYGSKMPMTPEDEARDNLAVLLGVEPPAPTKVSGGFTFSPDGKLLAFAHPDGTVPVVDVLTGKSLAVFQGHTGAVNAVAFTPDGNRLASASADTTALLWDLSTIKRPATTAKAPTPADLDAWWQVLADSDAAKAFATMGDFLTSPSETGAFLKVQLKPAAPLDRKRIADLMAQLDDNQYEVRDRASGELLKIGAQLVPDLDKALAANLPPEPKRRLEELRTKLTDGILRGDHLRLHRAVELLEWVGTLETRQVLQSLAAGAPGAPVTISAQAALKRQ